MKKIIISLSLLCNITFAECVHERVVKGLEIESLERDHAVYISIGDGIFKSSRLVDLLSNKKYLVQLQEIESPLESLNPHEEYDKKYLKYYTYKRMQTYLHNNRWAIESAGYKVKVIGKSVEGRDLYSVTPKKLLNKKTVLMFGRHHGDEGTANWIIEGFFNEYLSNKNFRENYQLILYPMINPDGAEAHSRYNSNGRDLNRSWDKSLSNSYDEIKYIHSDLKPKLKLLKENVLIALDMHGSFTEDFIYRVKRNYVSTDFYHHQQNFIDELKIYDPWQNGNYKKSNGDKAMARIVLIDHYNKNAMTHESIRNISKTNSQNRSLTTLKDQGLGIIKTISNLY